MSSCEKNQNIVVQIHDLELNVHSYWQILNQEAIWLFLATLGVWSVDHDHLQTVAYILTFILFIHRIYLRTREGGFYTTQITEIEANIKELVTDSDAFKARTFDLDKIKQKLKGTKSIKGSYIYVICGMFYVASVCKWSGLI